MHEVALRRDMKAQIQAYKQNPRPQGANVRPMTSEEQDSYTASVASLYDRLEAADNQAGDTDSARGRISRSNRTVNDGMTDSFPRELKDDLTATFGGRSKCLEMTQEISNRPLYDTSDPGSSSTDMIFAEQNIGFLTGISLQRDGDTVSGAQFFVDRFHPEKSVIAEQQPATAREI